jgi:simple sugar transport system permease protein
MTSITPKIRTIIMAVAVFLLLAVLFITHPIATAAVLSSGIRQSTPLVLGALCGLFCERSGVMNLGIEGQMLFSAYAGFMVAVWTGNLFLGMMAAVTCGAVLGVCLAVMAIHLKTDQIIAGTVVNILAIGLTGYFYPMGAALAHRLEPVSIPLLSRLPHVGHVLFDIPDRKSVV